MFHDMSYITWSQSAEDDAKFSEFSKRAENGPSPAGKNVSWSTRSIPVSSGNLESRLSIPLGLGICKGWLGTWRAPELFQDRKILLHRQRNALCSVNPEFEARADSQWSDSSPVAQADVEAGVGLTTCVRN